MQELTTLLCARCCCTLLYRVHNLWYFSLLSMLSFNRKQHHRKPWTRLCQDITSCSAKWLKGEHFLFLNTKRWGQLMDAQRFQNSRVQFRNAIRDKRTNLIDILLKYNSSQHFMTWQVNVLIFTHKSHNGGLQSWRNSELLARCNHQATPLAEGSFPPCVDFLVFGADVVSLTVSDHTAKSLPVVTGTF